MSSQYPQNFLHRPTTAEYDELARLSAEAEANRLEGGDQLVWNGEQLEAGVLPPEIYPHDEFSSPAPLRALHSKLVDPHSRPSARPWTLTLVEALQSGSDQWSQVWRGRASCAVARRDSESWPVVLKLYHQALFPPPLMHESNPEHDSWNWHSAAYRQEREALVYRRARLAQGSDIPLCYGFFKFRLPSGEHVVGVVLEDLVDASRGLGLVSYLSREAKAKRLSPEQFDAIACEALRLQNRLHKLDLAGTSCRIDSFVYLRSTSNGASPTLVNVGFGQARSKETHLVGFKAAQKTSGLSDDDWCQHEQRRLFGALEMALWEEDEGMCEIPVSWARLENERQALDFIRRPL